LGRRARGPSRRLGAPGLGLGLRITVLRDVEPVVELGAAPPAAQALRPPDQERTALGTRVVGHRWMVDGEVAVRVSLAPVHQPEPRPPLDDLALLALRAGDTGRLRRVLLDVLAVRVPGAAHERPEATELALQRLSALGGGLVAHLGRRGAPAAAV